MLNVVVATLEPLFTLDEAKQHLRVEHSDDDALITLYADAAVTGALQYCNTSIVPKGAEAQFRAAALLMLGDLYAHRETVVASAISSIPMVPNARWLINPYRNLRV